MMRCTSKFLVPAALCAVGLFALVFQGCERKSDPPAPPAHTPQSYMNDPAFTGKLAEARKAQIGLVRERNDIAAKMKAKIDAMRAKLKTDDLEKVRAELEKDPEWCELYVACTNANARCVEHRRKTLGDVARRLTPPKAAGADKKISK